MGEANPLNDVSKADESVDPITLTNIYKKNGSFDKQRKLLLENFKKSETHSNLLLKLKLMIENKIKQDPTILMKNKGKMGALIQGEIINQHLNKGSESGLLSIVDKDIQDKIIDSPEFHEILGKELKDIRRIELNISDEDYQKHLLEDERKKKALENSKQQVENDYRNNFKVKHLTSTHRVTKPPRFNFLSNNSSERNYRDLGSHVNKTTNDVSNGINSNSSNKGNNYDNNDNDNDNSGKQDSNNSKQSKDIPFMMY